MPHAARFVFVAGIGVIACGAFGCGRAASDGTGSVDVEESEAVDSGHSDRVEGWTADSEQSSTEGVPGTGNATADTAAVSDSGHSGSCTGVDPSSQNGCTPQCRCAVGQGDCDGDADCLPGLECAMDVGAVYGYAPQTDICQVPGGDIDTAISSSDSEGTTDTAPDLDCSEDAIPEAPNTLDVDVAGVTHLIPKEIFGVLMEMLGNGINHGVYVGTDSSIPNTQGIRNDIIDGFREAGVGAIQWPGGCAANHYDWEHNTNPSTTMGTDLFLQFCQWVGAEPYLVGPAVPDSAQSNRRWVEYVRERYPGFRYFKIGNEVWGCGGDLGNDVATYEHWYNAHYEVLQDLDLFLVGATGGIWTVNPNTTNWLTTMMAPGHLLERVDGIEIHDYIYFPDSVPCVGFSEDQYYDIVNRANQGQIAQRLRDIRTILDRYDPQGRVRIMLDEWGDWLMEWESADTWLQMGTLMDAISAAEQLHLFMANGDRILMAGLAQAVNVIHALFLTNSRTGGTDLVKTPTFYVFQMFVPHHIDGARWAPIDLVSEDVRGFPVLSAGATVNRRREVTISLVNVDLDSDRWVRIALHSDAVAYEVADAQVITGPARDSYNDFGQPEVVTMRPLPEANWQACGRKVGVALPPKSIVRLTLRPN